MGGEDEREAAGRALGGERADLGAAARTQVARAAGAGVACAEGGGGLDGPGGESHHQQGVGGLGAVLRYRGRGHGEHQVAEVLLVQDDVVVGAVGVVGLADQFGADGDLGGEADDGGADLVRDEVRDGAVDIAWVGGVEGAEDEEDLARAVARGVKEGGARHFQGVFEGRVAFWFGLADLLDGGDVGGGVAGHVANADGDAVVHAYDAELGDGVLLEELVDEGSGVDEGEEEASWSEVLFIHGLGHVQDEDEVTDDASLQGGGVFQ